ncbi:MULTISPECIES: hypothetical protein [Clostridium]|uniref:Uncharacterized protein n=2 Tax=Clostridium TaxID=1485 RepID=A0A381JAF2_9CLOT|nr:MULTISPECIES: hypothetical protein [Clostridium]PPK44983.1 hypothetical protein BD821_12129 [Clostridium algidicarnis DSM 15099]SUY47718.1 Uncharacterised protein [Clostridium putrefaciens]
MYKNDMQVQPTTNEDGISNLANAIILQAVKDYRSALKALKKYPYSVEGNKVKSNVERFFRSKWYSELTTIDGNMLIKELRDEV